MTGKRRVKQKKTREDGRAEETQKVKPEKRNSRRKRGSKR